MRVSDKQSVTNYRCTYRLVVLHEPTFGLVHKDGKRPGGAAAAPSFLGEDVNHWLGMSQSAPQWPTHTWPLQAMQQEPSTNKLLTGRV